MCENKVCSNGTCIDKLLQSGEACPNSGEDGDCSTGRCGSSSYPLGDHVCCPSGNYLWKGDEFYCTEFLGISDTCDQLMNALCA
jgi:hypothetical protein